MALTRRHPTVGSVGEHAWIARLLRRLGDAGHGVVVGPGDDAAVLRPGRRPIVVTTDSLVDGVHFRRDWLTPRALGQRAFRTNASDLAAMGARPWVAVVAIACPPTLPLAWLDGVVRGFAADARAASATLVGGNLARGADFAVTVAFLGTLTGRALRRSGARVGDDVWVTGTLGGSGWAVRQRLAGRRAPLPPVPRRWEVAVRLAAVAHAAIDVSDGLVQDLGHVCRASGVGAEIALDAVPCAPPVRADPAFAATAGEDYELVVVAPPAVRARVCAIAARAGCRITRVGRIVRGAPRVRVLDGAGRALRLPAVGFDHFGRHG